MPNWRYLLEVGAVLRSPINTFDTFFALFIRLVFEVSISIR